MAKLVVKQSTKAHGPLVVVIMAKMHFRDALMVFFWLTGMPHRVAQQPTV